MKNIIFLFLMASCICSCSILIPEKYLQQLPFQKESQQQQGEIQTYSKKDLIGTWILVGHKDTANRVYSAQVDLRILEFTKNGDMNYSSEQNKIEKMKYKIKKNNKLVFIDKNQKKHHASLRIELDNLILIYEDASSDRYKKIINASKNIYKQGQSIINNELISMYGNCISGNCVNGYGTYLWPTGDKYIGQWKDGKKNGWGTLTCPDNSDFQKYVGEWKDDDFCGQGTLTYNDKKIFTGTLINGKKEGRGILYNANGTIEHKGKWSNDIFISQ